MKVQIRAKYPSKVKLRFVPGLPGPQGPPGIQGIPGDITPEFIALAQQVNDDRVQTGQDRAATGADRIQTGQDRAATAADRVQTGLDAAATAADRVQTGQDKTAASTSAALSQQWATKTDAEVAPGQGYGSKKYAQDSQASATQAAETYTNFRNVFYGPLAADPTTRPDGSAIQDGDIYYRTTAPVGLKLRKDGAWTVAVFDTAGALLAANNLNDLPDKAAARTNLAVLARAGNLSELADMTVARANLGVMYKRMPPVKLTTSSPGWSFVFPPSARRIIILGSVKPTVIPADLRLRFTTDGATWQSTNGYAYAMDGTQNGAAVNWRVDDANSGLVTGETELVSIGPSFTLEISNNMGGHALRWRSSFVGYVAGSPSMGTIGGFAGWGPPAQGVLLFPSAGLLGADCDFEWGYLE